MCTTQTLDFPEFIAPGNMRNDCMCIFIQFLTKYLVYITLHQGSFPDSRNVRVQCRVYIHSKIQSSNAEPEVQKKQVERY